MPGSSSTFSPPPALPPSACATSRSFDCFLKFPLANLLLQSRLDTGHHLAVAPGRTPQCAGSRRPRWRSFVVLPSGLGVWFGTRFGWRVDDLAAFRFHPTPERFVGNAA